MSDDLFDLNGLAASLEAALASVLAEAGGGDAAPPAVELTLPARPEHGDLTTNAAMVSAKRAKRPPRELAQAVGERWMAGPGAAVCDRFEVAGPGFLNLFLDDGWFRGALARMLQEGADYGRDALPEALPREGQRGVRERQPRGPAARRQRPLRRHGRRPVPHLRLRRSRRDGGVLRERRRHADGALRPDAGGALRPGARHRRAGAGERLSGRVRGRSRPPSHRRGRRQVPGGDRVRRSRDGVPAGRRRHRDQALGPGPHARGVPCDAGAAARPSRRVDERELHVQRRGGAPLLPRRGRPSRWPIWTARASSTRRRAPSGSRRPATATTRTACSSAPPASPPTSSRTSPITATRWTAASRA